MGCLDNYPKHVLLVLVNEFCERFSYYGMKVILVLYLTRALKYSDSTAVSIYHAFSAVCYFTPILGAMVADGWLGKFKTILYVSMIYALGNVSMSITAIPFGGEYLSWGVFIGLILIGIGSGGIKPCVSAFGGDQFKPDQVKQKESFFSLFYMFINIGSLLTTIITPYVRSNVFCFDDNCYCLAFGIPAILMIISIVVFACGSPWYTKYPAGESILSRIFGCVWTALKCKLKCGKTEEEKVDHWLDYAEPKYGADFVSDVKDVFGVLWLFLPLPFFWAVYDQQGSRWTLQATQMDGDFGSFVMQPDMMGIMNSVMVVTLAPLLASVIYPILDKLHIPNTPLQRMTFGMLFAATAFLLSGFMQVVIEDSFPAIPGQNQSKVIFINSGPCKAKVQQLQINEIEAFDIDQYTSTEYVTIDSGSKSFHLSWACSEPNRTFDYTLDSEKGYQIVLLGQYLEGSLNQTQVVQQTQLTPTPDSSSSFSFYNDLNYAIDLTMHATKSQEKDQTICDIKPQSFSKKVNLVFAEFDVYMNNKQTNDTTTLPKKLSSKNGAIYTVLLANDTGTFVMEQLTDMGPRTVNIFLQVPQYLLLTIGECLFSITGLAFAYSQAPASMKSLLTAAWLLTVAVGNLIIIIIAETTSDTGNEVMIFFLFAGLLYVVTILFAIMSYFYKYVEVKDVDDNKSITSSSSSSSSGISHSEKSKKPVVPAEMAVIEEKAPLPSNDVLDADSVKETELNEKSSPPNSDSGYLAKSASDVNNESDKNVSIASNDSDEETYKF